MPFARGFHVSVGFRYRNQLGYEIKDLDQVEKRLNRKLSDGEFDARVIAVGKEVDMSQHTSPADMDYVGSFEQMGEAILTIHGIGKAFVGLTDNMTYGGNAAAHQMAMTVVQSDLDLLAGEWTQLAQVEGEAVAVEYEVQPIDDPALVEQQITTDITAGIRTAGELRSLRGLPDCDLHGARQRSRRGLSGRERGCRLSGAWGVRSG